jgi:hypothetical protein
MSSHVLQLALDQRAAGQVLESLADRLLRLERIRDDEIDEDAFADAKNDAVALRPLSEQARQRAVQIFDKSILDSSTSIGELDAIHCL